MSEIANAVLTAADQLKLDKLYEGDPIDNSIDGPMPPPEVPCPRNIMCAVQPLNKKWMELIPTTVIVEPQRESTAKLVNNTTSRLAFKIELPVYPHLSVWPLSGFIPANEEVVLTATHAQMARFEKYQEALKCQIVACAVPDNVNLDVTMDNFFISLNGCTQMTFWANMDLVLDTSRAKWGFSEHYASGKEGILPDEEKALLEKLQLEKAGAGGTTTNNTTAATKNTTGAAPTTTNTQAKSEN